MRLDKEGNYFGVIHSYSGVVQITLDLPYEVRKKTLNSLATAEISKHF